MNINLRVCLVILLFLAIANSNSAQVNPPGFSIKGRVADSSATTALSNITIKLYSDSLKVFRSAITNQDGSFSFNELPGNKYFVGIEAVGYDSSRIPITFQSTDIDLGTLFMVRKNNSLKEVVVIGNRNLIRQEVDKVVYDLQADPESKSSSIFEMMRKVPFLSLDADGNILLNGGKDFKILINGKPSTMMDRSPKDILRSIPASTIKSIEVITSPSSKYDAEGLAGIINIITHRKIDNGYNGSLNINYKSPVGGPGMGGSISIKNGKFGITAFGGAGRIETPITNNIFKNIATGGHPTILDQHDLKQSDSRNAYFGTELSFEVDSLQLISVQLNSNGYKQNASLNQSSIMFESNSISHAYKLDNVENSNGHAFDLGVNYQLGFKKNKEQLLTFSYRYTDQLNEQLNYVDIYNSFKYDSTDYSQENSGSLSEQTAQVDYVHPFKKVLMEGGVKAIFRKNYSEYAGYSLNELTGKFEPVVNETNNYRNDQNVLAVYNAYKYNMKSWTVKAGLRIEQTYIDADFISTQTKVDKQYTSMIPSFALSKKINTSESWNLTYTNRIRRPTIYQLNPFVNRSNPQQESSGNPDLQPAYTNIVQLAYNRSKKSTINIAFGAMFFNKIIGTVATYDESANITRRTYENMGNGRILKTNIFYSLPITKQWNLVINSDLRHISFWGQIDQEWVEKDGFNAYVNLTSGYRFNKGLRLNAGITIVSGGMSGPQSTSNGYINSYLSVSKDFFKDKLNFSCSLSDPFSKFRVSREELEGNDFRQLQESQLYYRSVSLSLNYKFGKLKDAVKKK